MKAEDLDIRCGMCKQLLRSRHARPSILDLGSHGDFDRLQLDMSWICVIGEREATSIDSVGASRANGRIARYACTADCSPWPLTV